MPDDKTDIVGDGSMPRRGVVKQFFGCVLLSLGLLDLMLTLKSGIEADWFIYLLLSAGAGLLSVGVWQYRERGNTRSCR
jgi:hypothetical protein